jgi:hypothetical protein
VTKEPAVSDIAALATAEERARFAALQERFARAFDRIFGDPVAPRNVLIIPSLSLDQEVMSRISGVHH